MSELSMIENLKSDHERLYTKAVKNHSALKKNQQQLDSFVEEAGRLLDNMNELSAKVTSIDDYTWLTDAAIKWRLLFSSFLNIPREIRLAPPPRNLEPPQLARSFSEDELRDWISVKANELSRLRKVSNLLEEVEKAIEKIPSTKEEMDTDWRNANLDFASCVLDGRINFARQLVSQSYWRLEKQWLREVKQFRAYLIWENGEGGGTPESNYFQACEQIRNMLINRDIKAATDFQEAKAYLETRYLTKGRLDLNKPWANDLVESKASRVWEMTGQEDSAKNYLHGEKYVKAFYENIIPAVTQNDPEKTLIVLKAFQYSRAPDNRYLLINCFEAALAIYFLDTEIIEGIWREAEGKAEPASWTISIEPIQYWPENFSVHTECRGSFHFDDAKKQITFEGVMTHAQKKALLDQLTDSKLIDAVERLFEQSRLLPKRMTL